LKGTERKGVKEDKKTKGKIAVQVEELLVLERDCYVNCWV